MSDWIRDYYDMVDGFNAVGMVERFAEDGTFKLANLPAARGRAEIAAGNRAFWDTIGGLRHDFTRRYSDGPVDILEADVTYTAKSGGTVTVPAIAVLERNDEGLITASRSYLDMAPLRELTSPTSEVEPAREWLERFISAVDTLRVEEMLPFFAESATFTYGNNPAMVGADGIREGLEPFHASIAGLSHEVRNCYPSGPHVIVAEYSATYTRHDGRELTLPAAGVFELAGGLIQAYRVYADVAPVFA